MTVTRTSLDAYDSVDLSERQIEVMAAIQHLRVCSDQDIAAHLGWPINRITPRRGELAELNLIVKCGEKLGETGRRVSLWSLPRKAPEQLSLGIAA